LSSLPEWLLRITLNPSDRQLPKRRTFLARHRQNKAELVHVQQLEACATPEADLTTISRLSHPSFLRLLRCYQHEGSTFLFWEPVELSLAQVIGTKYSIREAELVSIVWPVSSKSEPLLAMRYQHRSSPHSRLSREFDTYGTQTEPLPPSRTRRFFPASQRT
jgi:hypothetical protein